MTRNDFILKIASQISDQMDGDLILLIEQYLEVALADMAIALIDTNDDKAEKFRKSLTGQSWTASAYDLPADILLHKQKKTVVLSLTDGSSIKQPVFQVDDWQKLLLIPSTTLGNHYCVLENNKFLIREKSASVAGSNLNINYYRIPTIADVGEELQPMLIAMLSKYIPTAKSNG